MEGESQDVDQQIAELSERADSLTTICRSRSAVRVARETRRLTRANRRLVSYLEACRAVAVGAQSLLEPVEGAQTAIEIIALLESEEKARQFQPDFPQRDYDFTISWMLVDAYNLLAHHTAAREGYNSDGVHAAITEGVEICRRTGSARDIRLFREEFACDVQVAAGDITMALHHAQDVANTPKADSDRRWCGADRMIWPLLFLGQLSAARDIGVASLECAQTFHNTINSRLQTKLRVEQVLLMQGGGEAVDSLFVQAHCPLLAPSELLPEGEDVEFDLFAAWNGALAACCRAEYPPAIAILDDWDRRLTKLKHVAFWFENRVRQVAAYWLAGERETALALARQCHARAKASRNWLTIDRLRGLIEGTVPPSPLALLAPACEGPFAPRLVVPGGGLVEAPQAAGETTVAAPGAGALPASAAVPPPPSPMVSQIQEWLDRFRQSEGREGTIAQILAEILQVPAAEVSDPGDACWLLFLVRQATAALGGAENAWHWAQSLAARFPQSGNAQNLLADLGAAAREALGEKADELVTVAQVEAIFRQSLDLEPDHPRNFGRAAMFYLALGKQGDAEQCLARGFRLDRTDPLIVLNLAQIYSNSDRPRDALAVLDLALREGCEHPRVAWEAGLTAFHLGNHESAVTYFDRYESLEPDQCWTHYYRAWSLLELARVPEAMAAVEVEGCRQGDLHRLHVEVLRAWAASAAGDVDRFCRHLAILQAMRLAEVDYLTESGLGRLLAALYKASGCLPGDAPQRSALDQRLLESGMAPDELFQVPRKESPVEEDLGFYICQMRQPLDDRWPSFSGCLCGQGAWKEYLAAWGVLARDEAEANRLTAVWQARCYPLPAEVLECALKGGPYRDSPGVIWQGVHRAAETA